MLCIAPKQINNILEKTRAILFAESAVLFSERLAN